MSYATDLLRHYHDVRKRTRKPVVVVRRPIAPEPEATEPQPPPEPERRFVMAMTTDDEITLPHPSVREIVVAVAKEYGLSPLDIISHRRTRNVTGPRQLVMYIASRFTPMALSKIGRALGRDHTTVLNGARRIAKFLGMGEPVTADDIGRVSELVRAHRIALDRVRQ